MPDTPTLTTATTAAEILEAVARFEYWEQHKADCPRKMIPKLEKLAAWLPESPETAWRTLSERAEPLLSLDMEDLAIALDFPGLPALLRVGQLAASGEFARYHPDSTATWGEAKWGEFKWGRFGRPPLLDAVEVIGPAIKSLHQLWRDAGNHENFPPHPLAPLVEAWQDRPRRVEPFRPTIRASLPRLDRVTADEAERLPRLYVRDRQPTQGQLFLPGLQPDAVEGSWLLDLFDRTGGQSMQQGRGAPWPMRLWIGALIHAHVRDRDGSWVILELRTKEVVRWLHPNGWKNRRRDWEKFPEALYALDSLRFNVPGYGALRVVSTDLIPTKPHHPGVIFNVRVPQSAASGSRIDWPTLCRYGAESAPLYRAYLAAVDLMDRSARRGQPITRQIPAPILKRDGSPARRKGGALIRSDTVRTANPAVRYVRTVTDSDLARMIGFRPEKGKAATWRKHKQRAREAFKRLDRDGMLELDTVSTPRRRGQPYRYQVFGPDGQSLR